MRLTARGKRLILVVLGLAWMAYWCRQLYVIAPTHHVTAFAIACVFVLIGAAAAVWPVQPSSPTADLDRNRQAAVAPPTSSRRGMMAAQRGNR